jgi:hypothetical protein
MQVIRVLMRIGVKAQLDGTLQREAALERNRERILADLTQRTVGAGGET